MFDMLLESRHRTSFVSSWGRGVALTLHALVLGALWRGPSAAASAPPIVYGDLPPAPVGGPIVPLAPAPPPLCDCIIPLIPTAIPTIPEGALHISSGSMNSVASSDSGSPLAPPAGVVSVALVQEAPELLVAPPPAYPPLLRAAGVQGQVIVAAVVDTSGLVEAGSVRIVLSDNPGFDAAAMATVRAARFRPARMYGRAVRVLVQVPVVFRLS